MIPFEYVLVGATTLIFVSIIASKASSPLGVPSLLIFLAVGMLAGSDGPGGIHFDDPFLAQSLGVVALSFILFSGGLDTKWESIRPVLWKGFTLATAGVLLTAVAVGLFATLVLDFNIYEGVLLGAIVSSTDAAAVFAVLRSRKVGLKQPLKPLLELESGSNDPMAVFLTIGFTSLITVPGFTFTGLSFMLLKQFALGGAMGFLIGKLMPRIVNRLDLEYEGLYPVLSLSMVLFTYGATSLAGGNGFLAVYIAGLVLGNSEFLRKNSLLKFHDGLAWLMQIAMFLTLGLLVFPSRLVPIIPVGIMISLFLIFIARPASVFLTLFRSGLGIREKVLVSWVGLRGAVPIILATFPLLAGMKEADTIFNIVFFIVLTSALIQGASIPFMARVLGVAEPVRETVPLSFEDMAHRSQLVPVEIGKGSPVAGKKIVDIGFPKGALIAIIWRDDAFMVPNGKTVLLDGDKIFVMGRQEAFDEIFSLVRPKG